jgi:c-di-GMP-binding flagellar brake protein YcgR
MNYNDKRQFRRIPVNFDANYISNNACNGNSKIIDISPDGMAIYMHAPSKITKNTALSLLINIPQTTDAIQASVNLKWVRELTTTNNYNFIAGCKFINIDAEIKRSLLEFAYGNWFRTV